MGTEDRAIGVESAALGDRVGRRREDRIVGASAATQRAMEQARNLARNELPVALAGPPGAGKEFLGRAIHAWSARRDRPFDVVSCAAIPEALQAREIFGCSAGVHASLPGAHEGRLAAAAGGSILLADVEGLQPSLRTQLLRAISDGRFRREGDGEEQALTARVFVTKTAVDSSWFGDLPHQEIHLLPLSERTEDILPLAAHFLGTIAAEEGTPAVGFTPDARAWLVSEAWDGNVGELRERVRQAVRLSGQGAISAEALLLGADGAEVPSFKEAKRAFETRYVTGLLRRCKGNISRAARLAKKDRKDFYDVIRRTGVDPQQFRS
ncbi:MAG: sigma 54-interacting transcriptional regulator [Myxococcota bacterium]